MYKKCTGLNEFAYQLDDLHKYSDVKLHEVYGKISEFLIAKGKYDNCADFTEDMNYFAYHTHRHFVGEDDCTWVRRWIVMALSAAIQQMNTMYYTSISVIDGKTFDEKLVELFN
jgi:hypothetical protein